MKVRIMDSDTGQLHKSYKEQLKNFNIKTKDIEFKNRYVTRYNTIIENFTWDMLPRMMKMREPEWLNDKSRRIVSSIVVSTPGDYDGKVDFSLIIYDGYLE